MSIKLDHTASWNLHLGPLVGDRFRIRTLPRTEVRRESLPLECAEGSDGIDSWSLSLSISFLFSFSLTLSLSLSFSFNPLSLSYSLYLSYSHSFYLSTSYSLSFSLSLSYSHSPPLSLTLSIFLIVTLSLSYSLSLSYFYSLSLALSFLFSFTLFYHSFSHTLSFSPNLGTHMTKAILLCATIWLRKGCPPPWSSSRGGNGRSGSPLVELSCRVSLVLVYSMMRTK